MTGLSIKDPKREQEMFASRGLVVFLIVVMLLGVLMLRFFQLQVLQFETYQKRADRNRIHVQPLPPQRGLIFDRNGEVLADNRVSSSLALVTERTADVAGIIGVLGGLVAITPANISEFEQRLARKRRPFEPVVLRMSLTEQENAILAVNRHRLIGVEVTTESLRHYPYDAFFAHAVGSVRRITEKDLDDLDQVSYRGTKFLGKQGVEKFYERSLHGEAGFQRVETDAHGRIRQVLEVLPPIAGQNISLHLDARLQIAATAAMEGRRGAVVALDPRSGGILALVSQPSYNPNLFIAGMSRTQYARMSDSVVKPLFNRAIKGQYAPGSTYKPVVGLAGIASQTTTWEDTIEDNGFFKLPNQERIYRDWNWTAQDAGGQGTVDLRRALFRSSNVFFYDLASRLPIEFLVAFSKQFGFGDDVSVDVTGANRGLMPDPVWKRNFKGQPWYVGDSVNLGIGQGDLLVTPMQMATVASAFANRGYPVRPRMLLSSDAPLPEAVSSEPMSQIKGLTSQDWEKMVDAMEAVVHLGNQGFGGNGTAWAYIGRDIEYRMAGKSGTAQVVEIAQGQEYEETEITEFNRKHAWFIAFAPADNPTIALAVLVENGGGGSSVAAPIARQVIDTHLLPQLANR